MPISCNSLLKTKTVRIENSNGSKGVYLYYDSFKPLTMVSWLACSRLFAGWLLRDQHSSDVRWSVFMCAIMHGSGHAHLAGTWPSSGLSMSPGTRTGRGHLDSKRPMWSLQQPNFAQTGWWWFWRAVTAGARRWAKGAEFPRGKRANAHFSPAKCTSRFLIELGSNLAKSRGRDFYYSGCHI